MTPVDDVPAAEGRDAADAAVAWPEPDPVGTPPESAVNAAAELARLSALPLDERAAVLAGTVQRLEEELDATEARPAGT